MPKDQITTEADALREILAWSQDRPARQRDALRRLVIQGELSDADIDDLTALCKDSTKEGDSLPKGHINAQHKGAGRGRNHEHSSGHSGGLEQLP